MAAQDTNGYQVVDTLYRRWAGDPARPVLIGEPGMVRTTSEVPFEFRLPKGRSHAALVC